MTDQIYQYTKVRHDFGRQPVFCETLPHLLDSINPDGFENKKYCLRNPVHREVQASSGFSRHDINTPTVEFASTASNHAEGGWPKDINFIDEEATTRYRRRIERSDDYVEAVLSAGPKFEHVINQNNAINVYELYYKGIPEFETKYEKPVITMINKYKDPLYETVKRPIGCIGWTYEDIPKMVVAYCNKKYPVPYNPVNTKLDCYVWNVEIPSVPIIEFVPPTACWQISCSPTSSDTIIGGLADGRVCIFDTRNGTAPVGISEMHLAHRDPVTSLIYIESRLSNEFFSGSSDGMCLWYDIRDLSKPFDSLLISVLVPPGEIAEMSNTEPVSVLQFQKTIPTRFLCGTDTGLFINVNRKGKTHRDIMSTVYEAHLGPVKALHRNPSISKMIISCGDWTTHIWSDDHTSCPIITGTSQRYQIEDVVWAPNKVSSYMSVGNDGYFRYWDVLRKLHEPILVIPMTKRPLLKIKPQNEGRIVALGDDEGNLYVLSLSENLAQSGEGEKQMMIQRFERENRREHILEARVREIRVKINADKETVIDPTPKVEENIDVEMAKVEREYRKSVLDEIKKAPFIGNFKFQT